MRIDAGSPLLDEGRLATLRQRVLALLSRHGVKLGHAELGGLLAKAGARVDGETVRFPEEMVEETLALAPRELLLAGRGGAHRLPIPHPQGGFHLRTGTGAHGIIDGETGAYRKLVLDDAAALARLATALDGIGFVSTPFVNDVPTATADIHGFRTVLANTDKHAWIQPYSEESIGPLLRLAAIVAGGEDALARNPLTSCIATSFTPLEFKPMDAEVVLQCARAGVPIHACSLPTAGGTAPVTLPAVVVMAAAEIVAQVAMAQIIAPGTPVIATPLIFSLDMRTGRSLQSSPEAMQGAALAVRLLGQGFGLPTHTYGSGADTPAVDGQSMAERALLGLTVAAAGADILGGAGQLETATAASPVQMVLDEEIAGMIRRLLAAPEVDDETMAWDDLMAVEPGGHFLATRHTLRHCREGFAPRDFLRQPRDSWEAGGASDTFGRARESWRRLMAKEPPPALPDDVLKEMDAVVAAADRALAG